MNKFDVFKSSTRYERHVDLKKLKFIYKGILRYAAESAQRPDLLKILEVGCGDGSITVPLSTFGGSVTAFDIDEILVNNLKKDLEAKCAKNVSVSTGNAYNYESSDRFHIVVASEVLEHVSAPDRVVRNLQRHLVKGGYLIVTVPNGYGPWELKNRFMRTASSSAPGEKECGHKHVQFFRLKQFVRLVEESQFSLAAFQKSDAFSGLSYRASMNNQIACIDLFLADILPSWAASGWYFVFRNNANTVLQSKDTLRV